VKKLYPEEADHICKWCAQRIQHPEEKINHALVLGGQHQGIGKDTLLAPVRYGVGPWNFTEVSPQQVMDKFTGHLKSVIVRVSEARDLGESNRYKFYDHTKPLFTSPPETLRVNEKNLKEYNIINCVGWIITTNYKTHGIYLPPEDRRHFVAWSECTLEDFSDDYFSKLWSWYFDGGFGHVVAYLAELEISAFDYKAPPPKTPAFWDVVNAHRSGEEAELQDVLDLLGHPMVVTLTQISDRARGDLAEWLDERKNRTIIPALFERCGYSRVHNQNAKDMQWKFVNGRVSVYGKIDVPYNEKAAAIGEMQREEFARVNRAKNSMR
jgi:hypothetical protein